MDTAGHDKQNEVPYEAGDTLPRWLRDIERMLPIRSQFVISGNIRDLCLTPSQGGSTLSSLRHCLWSYLREKGFEYLVIYDPVDGISVHPSTDEKQRQAAGDLELRLDGDTMRVSFENLLPILRRAVNLRQCRMAVVVDYASRLTSSPQGLSDAERRLFAGCEKLAQEARPRKASPDAPEFFNPIFWLLNRPQDLPSWFTLDSEKIHALVVSQPDFELRKKAATILARRFSGHAESSEELRHSAIESFARETNGLTLQALSDISKIAAAQEIGLSEIDDAIRCFKVGIRDNPWKKAHLREQVSDAPAALSNRVKGQRQAIEKTVDILTRSVMSLTGAQARSSGNRPRGVLFFAGPTGVGKTELAKSLTQQLFGDERAYIRFDMSEFAEEHSGARLLGAPPGYVGYEGGGELTNAIRERPFSLVLFDEIEKAHPRLLDKFLQILEDGRLTDGRGETVYFSESLLIFTSNLGIYGTDARGQRVANVTPDDDFDTVQNRIKTEIENYFKFHLSRPEILNRIGDNIVVFDFIRPPVAEEIFHGMMRNVHNRLREEHDGLELEVPQHIEDQLQTLCTSELSHGGRGIGNMLETKFINPLARALFKIPREGSRRLRVEKVGFDDRTGYTVELS